MESARKRTTVNRVLEGDLATVDLLEENGPISSTPPETPGLSCSMVAEVKRVLHAAFTSNLVDDRP